MTFINMAKVSAEVPLKSAHYAFPRAQVLRDAFVDCLEDYYVKASTGRTFEARGELLPIRWTDLAVSKLLSGPADRVGLRLIDHGGRLCRHGRRGAAGGCRR